MIWYIEFSLLVNKILITFATRQNGKPNPRALNPPSSATIQLWLVHGDSILHLSNSAATRSRDRPILSRGVALPPPFGFTSFMNSRMQPIITTTDYHMPGEHKADSVFHCWSLHKLSDSLHQEFTILMQPSQFMVVNKHSCVGCANKPNTLKE